MTEPPAHECYRLRDLVVDVEAASVCRGDERLVLPPRTLDLLVALLRWTYLASFHIWRKE